MTRQRATGLVLLLAAACTGCLMDTEEAFEVDQAGERLEIREQSLQLLGQSPPAKPAEPETRNDASEAATQGDTSTCSLPGEEDHRLVPQPDPEGPVVTVCPFAACDPVGPPESSSQPTLDPTPEPAVDTRPSAEPPPE